MRVAAVSPAVKIADPAANVNAILEMVEQLKDMRIALAVFPELCITGYTCGDLFHTSTLLDQAEVQLTRLLENSRNLDTAMVVGIPVRTQCGLANCALFIHHGEPLALIPKTYLPNYNEFYEQRWWVSAQDITVSEVNLCGFNVPLGTDILVEIGGVKIGAEICEDLWVPVSPGTRVALAGALIVVNLSASPTLTGKFEYVESLVRNQSARTICGYVYSGAGHGESSTDLVFEGIDLVAANGRMLDKATRWSDAPGIAVADIDVASLARDRLHMNTYNLCARGETQGVFTEIVSEGKIPEFNKLLKKPDRAPFVPAGSDSLDKRCTEIVNIQASGLAQRLHSTCCKSAVIGISGGLDSTLSLLVTVRAFDMLGLPRVGITGVTMPGFGTTGRTHGNSIELMDKLGVTSREISIVPAVNLHFKDIGHDPENQDVVYENSQARQRTLLLMDIANQTSGMVIGTGDMSELALGWATYNGDHMSMYGVNAGVPKTLVRHLVSWFAQTAEKDDNKEVARVLRDVVDTPVSPELLPANADGTIAQRTEDLVGPYPLHDFFLYHLLRHGEDPERIFFLAVQAFDGEYTPKTILQWLGVFVRRFFSQQFKRSCLPDGPKVGSVCLSPRGDWRMPSDASSAAWRGQVEKLNKLLQNS